MTAITAPSKNTVPPRGCISDLKAYLPGKSIASVQRELGLKRVIKLASNENALGASPKALAVLKKAVAQVGQYPEGASPELREALAAHHGVGPENVVIGSGSDEVIRLLCEAYADHGDEVVVSQYGFIRYRQQASMMGARIVEVPAKGYAHDLEAMARAAGPRTKLLFVASPNNPTGTHSTAEEVRRLLDTVPQNCLVVLDEAYWHFAAQEPDYHRDSISWIRRYPNLVCMRTFSKSYGLAGLRVGYGVADPAVVSWIDRVRMPFNVNLPAQQACIAALKDEAFLKKSVALARKGQAALVRELSALGFRARENATNFLCVKSPVPGVELFQKLLRLGVIVRPLAEYGLADHVRISIGTPADSKVLVGALKKVAAELPRR